MPKFIAMTSQGLVDPLYEELKELGVKSVQKKGLSKVEFQSSWEGAYRVNLCSRIATRVLLPVLDFVAYKNEELYQQVKKHDFTKYISPDQTLAVDAKVKQSHFKDQRFVALKVKDAIVDQFWKKYGRRPDVRVKSPHLRVVVKVHKATVSIAIDTSGESLSQRGYRKEAGEAPLREHLAAGLLRMAGWSVDKPVIDPMCGSGTILIEAAMMARNLAPGGGRKHFAFQFWKTFKQEAWEKVVQEVMEQEKPRSPFLFYGYDIDKKVLEKAKKNAQRAGVEEDIVFKRQPVSLLEPPVKEGILIVNPPYGERLGSEEVSKDAYRDLAFSLKRNFKGWTCWLLSGNEEMTRALRLKASLKVPVYNGPIECRFLKYEIR
ncbi:MAG: RNA methyltransferase [Bdellovibrio sp.]|nr:MAG: RNA methyltransferase [Bdellovibrio sp.]